jgi:hypothetical protein
LAKFSTLLVLLKLASPKGFHNYHIYGDSKLCIGQMDNVIWLQHLNLIQLGQKLHSTARSFEELNFTHIFMELNIETDTLSKEELQLPTNVLVWKEFMEGSSIAPCRGHFLLKTTCFLYYTCYIFVDIVGLYFENSYNKFQYVHFW